MCESCKLLPCPHCGKQLPVFKKTGVEIAQVERYVEWLEISCTCGYMFRAFDCTVEQAIIKVNTRAALDSIPEPVEEERSCFNCKFDDPVYYESNNCYNCSKHSDWEPRTERKEL